MKDFLGKNYVNDMSYVKSYGYGSRKIMARIDSFGYEFLRHRIALEGPSI